LRGAHAASRIAVRVDDLRVRRFKERSETTTIFLVDASGSSAVHRLAEAKGAVELLLADCYVRRDQVAVIAFRGRQAEVILPPTRSLVRAKKSLAGLPGGGGTPLALAMDAAVALGTTVAQRGGTPVVVVLTDGRANVARDGQGGRERAQADASDAARQFACMGFAAMVIDTSPQPSPAARSLAEHMRARYMPLPHAGAEQVSAAVRVMAR
jgi:magnesium chelatase subunit D